ncbi:transcription factor bHLH113-like [Mercurialis annua]|uniref:transcription factor bHLH113-like n=1 Tax=Mercurialis annua TaxID=3986 RepID=UPI00215F9CFE|nr:transcription factor bHLH113-like [Mercurialis annua]
MADSEERDHCGFSQLLLSNDHDHVGPTQCFDHDSSVKFPKMLCFGGYDDQFGHHYDHQKTDRDDKKNNVVLLNNNPLKSGVTCSDSSSASSANNTINVININSAAEFKSNRKRNGTGQDITVQGKTKSNTIAKAQRSSKKTKMDNPISTAQPKARKAKLGERITALQQLVSPYGKSDTASVLHEAMGYIKFLQDQLQVLCSPYLQHHPEGEKNGEELAKELRSRGLCLVPVEYTIHVASSNGADYWSPAMVNNFSPSSSTKQ